MAMGEVCDQEGESSSLASELLQGLKGGVMVVVVEGWVNVVPTPFAAAEPGAYHVNRTRFPLPGLT